MGKEFQKSALQTLFHFVRVTAALKPHVVDVYMYVEKMKLTLQT